MKLIAQPALDTVNLGGVPTPSIDELLAMQGGDYILRARGGKLTRVPVEKSTLPRDPLGHVQQMTVKLSPDGRIYVNQPTMTCMSSDGGRSWEPHECDDKLLLARPENGNARKQILSDGTFLAITVCPENGGDLAEVWTSVDAGRTFEKKSVIPSPDEFDEFREWGVPMELFCGPDDTLIYSVRVTNAKFENGFFGWISGKAVLTVFRSADKGQTWDGPFWMMDWVSEGGMARMASGKLLAVVRYQRPSLPDDSPDLLERTGTAVNPFDSALPYPFKHVMLVDSKDGGRTWTNHRLLTSLFGQCYGFPVGLSDGTAVVVHDHRYPRHPSAGRAMVSHDEGETWEDEVYYMFSGVALGGLSQSVVLDDDVILTVGGVCENMESHHSWHGPQGNTDLTAIRWKPERG